MKNADSLLDKLLINLQSWKNFQLLQGIKTRRGYEISAARRFAMAWISEPVWLILLMNKKWRHGVGRLINILDAAVH